jgi:hypothetical protein
MMRCSSTGQTEVIHVRCVVHGAMYCGIWLYSEYV